jgi:hypothetical protein
MNISRRKAFGGRRQPKLLNGPGPGLSFGLLALLCTGAADAQVFVSNAGNGTISEYSTSLATVNTTLVSGLSGASALAASGSNLFVVESSGPDSGSVAEYTTSGATVNATLLSVGGSSIAVSGSKLFLAHGLTKVGEYTTSGATVNANLIGLDEGPYSIAATASNVYVAALAVPLGAGYVSEYDSTSGAPLNFNNDGIYVADGIAVQAPTPVPLPASVWLMLGGLGALGAIARRQRHAV